MTCKTIPPGREALIGPQDRLAVPDDRGCVLLARAASRKPPPLKSIAATIKIITLKITSWKCPVALVVRRVGQQLPL